MTETIPSYCNCLQPLIPFSCLKALSPFPLWGPSIPPSVPAKVYSTSSLNLCFTSFRRPDPFVPSAPLSWSSPCNTYHHCKFHIYLWIYSFNVCVPSRPIFFLRLGTTTGIFLVQHCRPSTRHRLCLAGQTMVWTPVPVARITEAIMICRRQQTCQGKVKT